MNPSLLFLIGLQLRSWLRYFVRNLRTVKGALLALVGLLVLGFWLVSIFMLPHEKAGRVPAELLRKQGPAYLLIYCLLNVVLSSSERGIYFTPAEVDFLFCGPYTRRQILAYKILTTVLLGIPTTLFLALIFRVHANSFLSAYVGLFMLFLFMSLLIFTLNLAAITLGTALYSRFRQMVLGLAVLLVALFAFTSGIWRDFDPATLMEQLEESSVWYGVTWPLRVFIETFLANNVFDLARWTAAAAGINLLLLALVFWLDANYLETAASSSARIYARIQRMRSGNLYGGDRVGVKVRFSLPLPPFLGGVGPTVWRQLTTAIRGLGRLSFLFLIFAFAIGAPFLAIAREPKSLGTVVGVSFGMTLWLTVLLSSLIPFDFRGDVDRLAELKALPISSFNLTLGQLLTPTMLLCLIQWVVLGVLVVMIMVASGNLAAGEGRGLLAGILVSAVFVPPFNFLLVGLENLLFLLFPVRVIASQPGDFQAVGRNTLFVLAKLFTLSLALGLSAGAGLVVLLLSSQNWLLALAASWVVLGVFASALVPAVAVAFNFFDVSRDTPP